MTKFVQGSNVRIDKISEPHEFRNDPFPFKGLTFENYCNGNLALVRRCAFPSLGKAKQAIGVAITVFSDELTAGNGTLFCIRPDKSEGSHVSSMRNCGDQEGVLVPPVENVKGIEVPITTRVRLHPIDNVVEHGVARDGLRFLSTSGETLYVVLS